MINRDEILRRTNGGLDVFIRYIPTLVLGKNFKSPFYEDSKASCNVYKDRTGIYRFNDFGDDRYKGDCFWFVAERYSLDLHSEFKRVLAKLCEDMGFFTGIQEFEKEIKPAIHLPKEAHVSEEKTENTFRLIGKYFSPSELKYWKDYGIDFATLRKFDVISVNRFFSDTRNGKRYMIQSTADEPVYAYKHADFVKIYRPKSFVRFLYGGTKPRDYIFGQNQLPDKGDVLFFTGGEKDVMSLTAHGFNAVSLNSETASLPAEVLREFKCRFNTICLLYDCDETGLRMSSRHVEEHADFELKRIVLPSMENGKDISDFFKKGGTRERLNFLLKEQCYYSRNIKQLKI